MGDKKKAEERGPVAFWLSEREELCLGLTMIQTVKADNRSERRQKEAILGALDLDWIEEAIDGPPQNIAGEELAKVFDEQLANGTPRVNAFVAVALHAFGIDKFASRKSRTIQRRKEISRELAAWLMEKLEKVSRGGVDDMLLSRIESRIADAKNDELTGWPEELVEIAPPAEAPPELPTAPKAEAQA